MLNTRRTGITRAVLWAMCDILMTQVVDTTRAGSQKKALIVAWTLPRRPMLGGGDSVRATRLSRGIRKP